MLFLAVAPYIAGMPGSRVSHARGPHGQIFVRGVDPRRILHAAAQVGPQHAPILAPHLLHSLVVFLPYVIVAVVAYLLGSIPTGNLLVRIFRRQDIRTMGSGNIGATNVARTGAYGLGAATFVCDVLKGCASVWAAAPLLGLLLAHGPLGYPPGPGTALRNLQALAALLAVLGNIFPVWLRFRGGKGVSTGFGVFLVAAPAAALAAIGVFALLLALSRYVSLASILGAASFPVFAWFFVTGPRPPFFFAVQCIVALLIVVRHHANIRRLLAGTETRIGAKDQA